MVIHQVLAIQAAILQLVRNTYRSPGLKVIDSHEIQKDRTCFWPWSLTGKSVENQ